MDDNSMKLHIEERFGIVAIMIMKGAYENVGKATPIVHRTMVSTPILFTASDSALARALTVASTA